MDVFDQLRNALNGIPPQEPPKAQNTTPNTSASGTEYTGRPEQSVEHVKATKEKRKKKQPITVTPQGRGKKTLINLLVTAIVGFIYFYIELPAINLKDEEFYFFFFILAAVYCFVAVITSGIWKLRGQDTFFASVKSHCKIPLAICAAFLILILVGSFLSGVFIRSRAYRDLLTVETGDFNEDVVEISYDQIPMLDRDSAARLGDRKLGELSDMVSQFEVSNNYTQINYQERPVRVTPLEYGDLVKWITNRSKGLPAYVMVDMVTQNAEVVRLDEGMRYTTTEHFSRNLYRHLRFQYPTFMFDEPTFEIDDDGNPYWICPRVIKRIGLFGGRDINGAVLVNAVTGESEYYETVPQWVDRVYSAELIIEQYDYYGKYRNGFLNSIFGQRDVTVTTQGYNYIALNDDVYVYTGVTSVGTDQSNVGFLLSNQRTKETKYYSIAGAEEYSAMSSAEGVVQHLNYSSTFPLLLNIDKQPTYFMALKDNAGLVKMYAMVNVRQYQIVATGASVAECEENYIKLMKQHNISSNGTISDTKNEITGVVTDIRDAVLEGNTYYYFQLDSFDGKYIAVSAADAEIAVIVNVGDSVKIEYVGDSDSQIVVAKSLEILGQMAIVEPAPETAPTEQPSETADESDSAQNA